MKPMKRKIFDTPHKNPFRPTKSFTNIALKKQEMNIILKQVKKSKGAVYGSTSVGKQSPYPFYKKPYTDIDAVTRRPKRTAIKTERKLDNWANQNQYYVEQLTHDQGTTYRVINRGRGRDVVADFSHQKNFPTRTVDGVKYETLPSRQRTIQKMIDDPNAEYRRQKDETNIAWVKRIREAKKHIGDKQ